MSKTNNSNIRRVIIFFFIAVSFLFASFHIGVASAEQPAIKSIEAGTNHSLVLKADGTLWAWGVNEYGQLGDGTTNKERSAAAQIGADTDWEKVSGGFGFTVAIKTDGTLWAWGYNEDGGLGAGTTMNILVPKQIGSDKDWAIVSAGGDHTLAIKKDGTLWAWGNNDYGQLGNGTKKNRSTPMQVDAATNWSSISAGVFFSVALKADGTLWTWGYNGDGQLGMDTFYYPSTPTRVGTDSDWIVVSAGRSHVLALKNNGTLWAWGANSEGQLGDLSWGGGKGKALGPIQVGTDTDWVTAAAGWSHSVALKKDGTLWIWGDDSFGELGDGTTEKKVYWKPVQVGTDTDWTSLSAGAFQTIALKTDGTLWEWGGTQFGNGVVEGDGVIRQIDITPPTGSVTINGGAATTNSQVVTLLLSATDDKEVANMQFSNDNVHWTPAEAYAAGRAWRLPIGDGVKTVYVKYIDSSGVVSPAYSASISLDAAPVTTASVAGGIYNGAVSVVLTADNAAAIHYTTDGSAPTTSSPVYSGPIKITTTTTLKYFGVDSSGNQEAIKTKTYAIVSKGWTAARAGSRYTTALKTDGTLWEWGERGPRKVGNIPHKLGANSWASVSTFGGFSAALDSSGKIWTWGYNNYNVYDHDIGTHQWDKVYGVNPKQVVMGKWTAIGAGDAHVAAVGKDGSLWTWGDNHYGQLGDATVKERMKPKKVGTASDWASVAAGGSYTVALKKGGTLWAWGANDSGQLGDGTTEYKTLLLQIGVDNDWASVSAGYVHTVAIKQDGSLWAWGMNDSGQLGDGTTEYKTLPLQIGSDTDWAMAAAGNGHTVAIKNDGSLWAWGDNHDGRLGDGTLIDSLSPKRIGVDSDWASVSAGYAHTVAIKQDGSLWAWGANDSGQLGDGTNEQKTTPKQITNDILFDLTLSKGGSGTVMSKPAGIKCGLDCGEQKYSFKPDTKVTLTAKTAKGYVFDGWWGNTGNADCSKKSVCVVVMDRAREVFATFLAVVPKIVAPAFFAFEGDFSTGSVSTGFVTIRNDGIGVLAISSVSITGDQAFTAVKTAGFAKVKPGKELSIPVTFKPLSTGKKKAVLTINSNDPEQPAISVLIIGIAI